jgi:pseudouridine kinase
VARNVAENLARLGHTTRLLTAVGDDAYGATLLQSARQAGVDVQGCWVLPDQASSTYLSIHGPDGDMALAVNDMRILDAITPERLAGHRGALAQAAAAVADCNLSGETLAWLFAHADATPVLVDGVSAAKCRRVTPWLGQVHTLKLNRLEAQTLSGVAVDTDAGIEQAAQWLHQQGVRHVVVSLGARGAYWSDREHGQGWQAALTTDVVNVSGAGDALMAGLVHAFVGGQSLADAMPFALACAALTLNCEGANHPGLCVGAVNRLLDVRATPT